MLIPCKFLCFDFELLKWYSSRIYKKRQRDMFQVLVNEPVVESDVWSPNYIRCDLKTF